MYYLVEGPWHRLQLGTGSPLQARIDGSGSFYGTGLPRVSGCDRSPEKKPGDLVIRVKVDTIIVKGRMTKWHARI